MKTVRRNFRFTAAAVLGVITLSGLGAGGQPVLSGVASAANRLGTDGDRNTGKSGDRSIRLSTATVESGVSVKLDTGVSEATVRAALRLIRLDLDSTFSGWTIQFKAPRTGYLGLTLVKQRRVEIYLRSGRSVEGIAHDLAHELGHAADVTFNNNDDRSVYLANRGLPETTSWWTCNSCGDLQVGAGDFAETFAVLVGPKYKFYSEVGPRPTEDQLTAIASGFPAELAAAVQAGGAPVSTPVVVAKR
jgi:hypothetical protein